MVTSGWSRITDFKNSSQSSSSNWKDLVDKNCKLMEIHTFGSVNLYNDITISVHIAIFFGHWQTFIDFEHGVTFPRTIMSAETSVCANWTIGWNLIGPELGTPSCKDNFRWRNFWTSITTWRWWKRTHFKISLINHWLNHTKIENLGSSKFHYYITI